MNNDKVNWRGCFPAAVTPFQENGEIDKEKFVLNLEILLSEGSGGFVICGASGESWALSPEEKVYLFRTAVEAVGSQVPIIAGTGDIRTEHVIDLSMEAKKVGVHGIMVIPPYYAEVDKNAILAHYKSISDEVEMPIMVYNHPPTTNINLDLSYLEKLMDLEWIVATKESAGNVGQIMEMLAALEDNLLIFTGYSARIGMPCALMGSPGFVGAMEPQIMGREGIDLFRLSAERQVDKAWIVQKRTMKCSRGIGAIGSTPANMKTAMNLLGRPGGFCRKPIIELNEVEKEKVRTILLELGLL